jgi:hypothetical protein
MRAVRASEDLRGEFVAVIEDAYRVSTDVGREVEEILREGREHPLDREEAIRLLRKAITALREGAKRRGDKSARRALEGNVAEMVERLVSAHEREEAAAPPPAPRRDRKLRLVGRNGVRPGPVHPTPVFHERRVPMNWGFVKTTDIDLWGGNLRLEVHRAQFRHSHGREPTPEELLDIMLSKMPLPGLTKKDQFKIVELARSIAVNGVQKPPILDTDGTLLDGNRRVAACYYILSSDEFSSEEKQRAEWLFVWQLTEHATEEDRTAVVVALNFEPSYKEEWPDYVKAKALYQDWQAMLALEPRNPGGQRQASMKRELSKKYALGPDTGPVNRFLKMIEWANDFEEYHIDEKARDPFEVMHRANDYFQYFDELSKGANKPSGVASILTHDDTLRHVVFDLLYEGKFKNWSQIRDLKHVHENDEAREILVQARHETDADEAQDHVERAITTARIRSAEHREVGANTRIETFVKWLEQLPVRAFRDTIKPTNLERLLRALRLVEKHAQTVLGKDGSAA